MVKYLIVIAEEIDGHSGASAFYIQRDEELSRAKKLEYINYMLGADSEFVESGHKVKREDDMFFYGDVITTFDYGDGDISTYESEMSVRFLKLPSVMRKDKIYGVETQTG